MGIRRIVVEDLAQIDPEDFEPYGCIIGRCAQVPFEDFPHLAYWTHHVDIGPDNEKLDMGLLVCRGFPGLVSMESHPGTREIFLPLEGTAVFLLAPPDENRRKVDLDRLRAVYMDGTLGVSLHKGAWHRPPYPVRGESVRFALLRKGELMDTTEFQQFGITLALTGKKLQDAISIMI